MDVIFQETMRKLLPVILALLSFQLRAQTIERYFESIRNNTAELTAFFARMPKGGDLHNHYVGSIYAETYVNNVVTQNYFINVSTLQVKSIITDAETEWVRFSSLGDSTLASCKYRLLQKWSVKDYNGISCPPDKQFFNTFSCFSVANEGMGPLEAGLLELKRRAQTEKVGYIETMLLPVPCYDLRFVGFDYNKLLRAAQRDRNEALAASLLAQLYAVICEKNPNNCARYFNDSVVTLTHHRLGIDDSTFTMRYQNYVVRILPPAEVFKSMVLAFQSADSCPLVVGVNIVGPEDNEVAMEDYWLHMQMFKFCHRQFPHVQYAMHAGELTLGLVKPEELTWHINAAVNAGAKRIGHGVDMPREKHSYELLRYMAEKDIAIEICPYSNEFILGVKNDEHPFPLYKEFGVPIVVCTDDAGVLRSDLIHQYVLLAKRYQNVSYQDIKNYVYNSINYSFIKEKALKEQLCARLRVQFGVFENGVLAAHGLR